MLEYTCSVTPKDRIVLKTVLKPLCKLADSTDKLLSVSTDYAI